MCEIVQVDKGCNNILIVSKSEKNMYSSLENLTKKQQHRNKTKNNTLPPKGGKKRSHDVIILIH